METGSEVMRKGGRDSMEKTDAQTGRQGLNRDVIKYIAMVTMLLNHIAHVFLTRGTVLHEIFEDVGYFTAPSCVISWWKDMSIPDPRSGMVCGFCCLR